MIGILCCIGVFCIVAAYIILKDKLTQKSKEKARKEYDEEQKYYEAIIRKLPSELVNKLFDLEKQAGIKIRLAGTDNYPEEFTTIFLATNAVINNNSYGTITVEQHQQIQEILDKDFKWLINDFIPAANTVLKNNANSDGLGFGVITNNAADAILYDALDTNERLKGNEKRIREYEEMIDKRVVSIIERIKTTLS